METVPLHPDDFRQDVAGEFNRLANHFQQHAADADVVSADDRPVVVDGSRERTVAAEGAAQMEPSISGISRMDRLQEQSIHRVVEAARSSAVPD